MPDLVRKPRHFAPHLLAALVVLAVLVPAGAQAATERARITWNTQTDIDLHVYDDVGDHAYYAQPVGIPDSMLSSDNTEGFGPESFSDELGPGTARTFRLQVCYFSGDSGATVVSGTITDGDGTSRDVSVTLAAPDDCAELGVSQGLGDGDGDGVPDGTDRCPAQPAPGTPDGCPPPLDGDGDGVPDGSDACPVTPAPGTSDGCPANRPPVAVNDHWDVRAGQYVYDNALKNDSDPDGDRFTPRVTSISFRAAEWSGMEPDGTFNYTSGPGTRVHQRKVITYHLVDEHGAASAPATVTVDVIPPGTARRSAPVRNGARRAAASAAGAPGWYSDAALMYSCFGSGFDTFCFGVLSPPQVQALNATTPWITTPSASEAARACARRFSGGGVARCVAGLVSGPLVRSGNKQIIRLAAQDGDCLLFRQELNRTVLHPVAGAWTSPQYSPIHSFLPVSKWGTWSAGGASSWQVPVSCTSNAAWKFFPKQLVRR